MNSRKTISKENILVSKVSSCCLVCKMTHHFHLHGSNYVSKHITRKSEGENKRVFYFAQILLWWSPISAIPVVEFQVRGCKINNILPKREVLQI